MKSPKMDISTIGEWVDQIFAMKILVEEYLGKEKKLYAAFMDLEKAYGRVDREVKGKNRG